MEKKKKKILLGAFAGLAVCIVVTVIIVLNLKGTDWDFEVHTEERYRVYQNYWLSDGRLMSCEDGYYYVVRQDGRKIMYHISKDAKSSEIICNQANCKHRDESCAAIWTGPSVGSMQYNNGYFFYVDLDSEDTYYLYRCQRDGTGRQPVVELGNLLENPIDSATVHNNHVIVTELSGGAFRLLDYNMEEYGKSGYRKVVCEAGAGEQLDIKDIDGEKMLYRVDGAEKEQLYEYDFLTKENRLIKELAGGAGYARYMDGSIVHSSDDGCKIFALNAPETVKDVTFGSSDFMTYCDGKIFINYIAMFDKKAEDDSKNVVYVYDKAGKLLDTIPMPVDKNSDLLVCYFGDESCLFVPTFNANKLYVYDKADIGTGKGTWRLLECK